jgi:hypothetical protein
MNKRKSQDPLALEIAPEVLEVLRDACDAPFFARDMERRGLSPDIELIEATLAKFWAPEQDDTKWDVHKLIEQIGQSLRRTRTVLDQLLAAQPRQRAAALFREREARAAELRRSGVRNPVAQAEKEIAEREGFASGPAFNRWLRRRRDQDKKSG